MPETRFYYLQSRYYDPELGRFLNSDSYASTGQGILGNNMFAYCQNNPIAYVDPLGTMICYTFLGDAHILSDKYLMGGGGYCGAGNYSIQASKRASDRVIANEIAFFTNTSEAAVLEAEDFAFYKGVLVIRTKTGNADSFSFGIIFLGDGADVNDADLLRHEYGHYLQLREIGLFGYITYVAIPSAYYFHQTKNGKYSWDEYYNRPWEYIADVYGGVTWEHSPNAASDAEIYWNAVRFLYGLPQ